LVRQPRSATPGARVRQELEQLREALRNERTERERHEATSSGLARRVADIYAKNSQIERERDELKLERDRLAAELNGLRQELLSGNGVVNGVPNEFAA